MTAPLSDDFPVLLGPVRVETTFTPTHLLVRVFPDEWSVDKFEPRPTEAEIAALDAYWSGRWAAAGRPDALEAVWHELVGRVPAGRATWLRRTRVPANPAEEPAGLPPDTTVLVVASPAPLPAADRPATVAYWSAVWRAHGDRRRLREAGTALVSAVGANRAAAIRSRRPSGVDAAAVSTNDVVTVAFLVLPPVTDLAPQSWTQAARARLLPDRFQVLGYVNGQQVLSATGAAIPASLTVSPDPGATDQLSVNEQTGALHVPDDLRWLTDFDRAVAVGMGLRIPLADSFRAGLDRLLVLGLRRATTPQQAALDLADLIGRQLRSPNGFGILPQGTPTNNSEELAAGPDEREEADAALRSAVAGASLAASTDWTTRTDGQQLVELLGLDPAVLIGLPNADRTDARDARAANAALWPMTWGSYLRTELGLDRATVDQTREFFLRYVSGRGPLPVVKIGRQPYGILPTTAFSRLTFPASAAHRRGLHQVLTAAAQDWRAAATTVPHLGGPTADTHQLLLDILALHPTSAEFHHRYALSVDDLFNRENLGGLGSTVLPALAQLGLPGSVRALLDRLGFTGADPDQLRRLWIDHEPPIVAPVVDGRPLSETDLLPPSTEDGLNYVRWLADHARTDLESARLELGFPDDAPPATLLYLLLRHAVLLGWADAADRLAAAAGLGDASPADAPFIHIRIPAPGEVAPSESRFRRLYEPAPAITGDPERLVVQFIPDVLAQSPATAQLAEQVDALDVLADLPTARLERVFTEHLDLATYRLDAWRLGLATERLAELRFGADGGAPPRRGLHLGAYGWLEEVRPRPAQLTPVTLTGPLATVFAGNTPLLHDPLNEGFIHAPSPSHARTAAVLRAGYLANGTPATPGAFAVNLTSDRVRVALSILDGLRQGQPLGALLGYRFERGLHDRHEQAEVDSFIAALRLAFPLRAGRIADTATEPDRIEQVEARNVIDGLALVRHVTRGGAPATYPFGLTLPPASPAQAAAITAEVEQLLDAHDALADLAVAEGTHQTLLGNVERASATLDAFAKDSFPPEPAVVETPRSGVGLTHRLALHLRAGLDPRSGDAPRAQAEPAVNDWLESVLPDDSDIAAVVTWTDPADGRAHRRVVTQDDLDLEPIELLWLVRSAGDAAMTELDDRIVGFVVDRDAPRPDAELTIRYTERVPGKVTFFEVSPLVTALRSLVTTSRALRPSDLLPAAGVAPVDRAADDAVSLPRRRPAEVRESLSDLDDDVAEFLRDLARLFPDPAPPRRNDVIDGIDRVLARYADLVATAASFGMTRSGWGEVVAWRRGVWLDVLAGVTAAADRMSRGLADADAILAAYDALPGSTSDGERFRLLLQAERLVTTQPRTPRPPRPALLRTAVANARRDLNDKIRDLRRAAGTNRSTLSGFLDDVGDELPLAPFDPAGLDLTPVLDRVVAFGREVRDRTAALRGEITARLAAADAALLEHDRAATGPERVRLALEALQALLGRDVLAVPEFTRPSGLADQVRRARRDNEKLVQHLTRAPVNRDFPVDDWLHGLARVREKPRLWERVVLLADALRDEDDLTLVPIQLPFQENDHWLGLEFAAGAAITEDRLLFTAHYAGNSFGEDDADDAQVGLLLDEWTEVIPAPRETTGIAVHFDGPDSEPPQAMLLVSPPVRTGTWKVDDLVAAINETFDLAKARAVEPEDLDDTAYPQLLPATVVSATRQPITISTDLAVANARWKADHD